MLINTKTMEYYEIAGVIHEGVWDLLTQNMPDSPATLDIHQRVWVSRNEILWILTPVKSCYPFDRYNQGDLC